MRLVAVLLLAASCVPTAPTTDRPPATTPVQISAQPPKGGRLVVGSFSDAHGLNPVLSIDPASNAVIGKIYEPLLVLDVRTGEPRPGLGSWTVSEDGLTFSWAIDQKATWSDGRPIVAKDFLARVKMQARSASTQNKSVFNDIAGYPDYASGKATEIAGIRIDAGDPKKFTVRFTRIFCPALVLVFGQALLPDHVFGHYTVDGERTKNADNAPENSAPPVASGPFKFKEWRRGDQIVLTRNDAYFQGSPLVDELVVKVVADASVLAAQLRTGELTHGMISPRDLAAFEKEPRLRTYSWPGLVYTAIAWRANNPRVAFLADKRVRKALAYGLDIEAVVRSALMGKGTRQLQHSPAVHWAAAPRDQLDPYPYDPAKAEDLLKQAGFVKGGDGVFARDGKPLAITIATNRGNREREAFLELAVEQYRRIGVRITPVLESFDSLVPKLTSGSPEIEAAIIAWGATADPDAYLVWHSSNVASPQRAGNNFVGYADPQADRLLEQGRNGPDCSQPARQKVYQELNRILNADAPYEFGFAADRILVADARIQGIAPGPFDPDGDRNINRWWIGK